MTSFIKKKLLISVLGQTSTGVGVRITRCHCFPVATNTATGYRVPSFAAVVSRYDIWNWCAVKLQVQLLGRHSSLPMAQPTVKLSPSCTKGLQNQTSVASASKLDLGLRSETRSDGEILDFLPAPLPPIWFHAKAQEKIKNCDVTAILFFTSPIPNFN